MEAVAAPLSATVEPLVSETGLSVPEMLHVGATAELKLMADAETLLTVTPWLEGVKV